MPRTLPDPFYGGQLQDFGVQGYQPNTAWASPTRRSRSRCRRARRHACASRRIHRGERRLRPLGPAATLSPRVALPMIGLGLLAAVPASDILTGEDPDDADGDGVSGRAQVVGSFEHDRPMIGRFGWRAGAPTAIAFASDISLLIFGGVGVCAEAQTDCRQAPHGDGDARGQEIGAEGLNLVTFYSRNLAVPARRDLDDPEVWAARSPFARPAAPRVIPQVRRGWRGSPSSAFS